jgi:SPP1 family predicted phage head-tail adaptor
MRSGKLRHYITIQQRATTQVAGSGGDQSTAWVDVFSGYADIRAIAGREQVHGQALQAATTHLVEMRYRAGVAAKMRVKWERNGSTSYLNITAPARDPDGRGRDMVFEAEQGLRNG